MIGMVLILLCLPSIVWAQLVPGNTIELRDEGAVQGRVRSLDCVGAGVACSISGALGTLSIAGGGGGAPTGYAYWGSGSDATLSAEINLAALATGLVINTAGTPSTYPGATCVNQVLRLLSVSGAATCATITSAFVDTSIWTGTAASGLLKASSQGVLAQAVAGTDYVIPAGTVATATALAADPADCGVNAFATSIDAGGTLGCVQPAFSNLSGSASDAQVPNTITIDSLTQVTTRAISDTTGTLAVGRGGTGVTTFAADTVPLATALDTLAAAALPSCSNGTTSKLLYNTTTHIFSCGIDQAGGGGGMTIQSTEIDFGASARFVAVATVTDAGVSGASKILTWQSGAAATGRQSDENEMDAITCNANPGAGVFTLRCHTDRTVTHGRFPVLYTVQ